MTDPWAGAPTPQAAEGAEPTMGYEQARSELEEVVRKLESGGGSLADSMALWERGEQLATICQRWLDGAKAKVTAARAAAEQASPEGQPEGE